MGKPQFLLPAHAARSQPTIDVRTSSARFVQIEGFPVTEDARSAWQGIEVRHLAALRALAEEASFHGAARRLGYSQPAVSQQLAALERRVGKKLVNRPRVSHPLTLTEAGQRLLVHAKAIQASLAVAEADLGGATNEGRLRIGTYQTIAAHLLPHVLRELARSAPNLVVVLDDAPGDERLVASLDYGEIDLAFVDLPMRFQRDLQIEPLAVDEYVLVFPLDSPQALRATPIGLEELRELDLIGFKTSGSTQRVVARLREEGVEPRFAVRSDDNTVLQGFLAAGFGAALVPRLTAELLAGEAAIMPIATALPPRVIALAWTGERSARAEAFTVTTRKVVARLWRDRLIAARKGSQVRTDVTA
jgi:DNA-binding transcriptional LysR family regulator